MPKPTIIVTKMGSICYTAEYTKNHRNKKKAVKGEQGTTEAVVHHLLSLDLNVIYFGQWRGDLPSGLIYVPSNIVGHKDTTTAEQQKTNFLMDIWAMDAVLAELGGAKPVAFVAIAGYASNIATVDNEWCITCQACAVRYTGPSINIMKHYNLPRITICNDTRNYPNEGEVASEGWEMLRSVALLSQRERYWIKPLQYERWFVDEKYAAAEHWRLFDERAGSTTTKKTVDCQIVGHAHMKDGKKLKGYDEAWQSILAGRLPERLRVYGLGWEHFSMYDAGSDENIFPGIADMKEVFARSKCTIITMTGGELYTNKARFALSQNCLPLFYGRGEDYTMDPLGKYVDLDSGWRITDPGDLKKKVDLICKNELARQRMIDKLWDLTSPDYSMLDECIHDLVCGAPFDMDWWREKYGGYYKTRRSDKKYSLKRI